MVMDESQTLILETQQRLLADWQAGCGHAPSPEETTRFWSEMGRIGLLGALAPQSAGGAGDDPSFTFEFLRQWGQAAAPGPMLTTLIGGSALLPGTEHEGLLAGISDGSVRLAMPTFTNAPGRFPDIPTSSAGAGTAHLPPIVFLRDGAFATHAILPARIGDEAVLLCVESGRLSLSEPFLLVDGATAAGLDRFELAVTASDMVARGAAAETGWIEALDRMTAAAACEAAGLLRAMLDQTVAYARQRTQFGQSIGSFQVVQHRLADMLVDVEQAHSLALAAIRAPGNGALVSAAKARADRSLRFVSDQAVQLHGGIGTTQELALNRYFRRAMALVREFGSAGQHLARVEAGLVTRMHSPRISA